jgi:hypothetical protein
MGFLDKFRKKKEEAKEQKGDEAQSPAKQDSGQSSTTGKRIKRYNSDGKPVYE